MKLKVLRKKNVYGCSFVDGFETTNRNEALAMEMVHGSRDEIEQYVLDRGSHTRDSLRFKGAVDRLIDYGVWQETRRLERNPSDHFGIDHPK